MKRNDTLNVLIKNSWNTIVKYKDEKNKFNEEFMQFAPELKRYILTRLKTSIKNENLPKDKYKVDDFLDQLFIKAYDNIKRFDSSEAYYIWLIQELDELLEDTTIEEEFNDLFFQNIENYTHKEWDAMQEEYSIDAGGDYVMIEELDDSSYPNYKYELPDILIENSSEKLINELSDKLSSQQIHQHIDLMVYNLPSYQREIFNHSVLLGTSVFQLAQIKSSNIIEIESVLKTIRMTILKSFTARFKNSH